MAMHVNTTLDASVFPKPSTSDLSRYMSIIQTHISGSRLVREHL